MKVSDVVDFLKSKGRYETVSEPLHVADLSFEFDAVLRGPGESSALVVVLDAQGVPVKPLRRRLAAFRTVLERTGGNRSMSAVLLSPKASSDDVKALSGVCRVIPVESDSELRSRLGVLLPLALPDPIKSTTSGIEALEERLDPRRSSHLTANLIRAARRTPEAVQKVLRKAVEDACGEALEGREEVL
jgi:hypothetical protein